VKVNADSGGKPNGIPEIGAAVFSQLDVLIGIAARSSLQTIQNRQVNLRIRIPVKLQFMT